jgi:hypothetical protein
MDENRDGRSGNPEAGEPFLALIFAVSPVLDVLFFIP